MPKPNEETRKITAHSEISRIMNIYAKAVEKLPLLRYSWILVATICILALAAYFKLKNTDVFFYAFGVILISFFGFLFSLLLKVKDVFIKTLLYLLISCIVITIGVGVLSFASFIVWGTPKFYIRWFPDKNDTSNIKKGEEKTTSKDLATSFNTSIDSPKLTSVSKVSTIHKVENGKKIEQKKSAPKNSNIYPETPVMVPEDQKKLLENLAPLTCSDRIDKDGSKHAFVNVTYQFNDGIVFYSIETSNDDAANTFDYHLEVKLIDKTGNILKEYRTDRLTMKSKSQISIGDVLQGKAGKAVSDSRNGILGPLDESLRVKIRKVVAKLSFDS